MTTLRIFITNESQSQSCDWILFDTQGQVLRQGKDALKHLPLADFSEVVIPSDWASFTPAKLPSGNRKRVLKALPYLVEDHTISNPEALHVVIAEQINVNEVILASIDYKKLKKIIAILRTANLNIQRLFPATMIAPKHDKAWVMVCDTQSSFLRLSDGRSFALAQDDFIEVPVSLRLAIERARSALHAPDEIMLYGNKANELSQNIAAWSNEIGVKFTLVSTDWKTAVETSGMNFLQGDFYFQHRAWAWLEQAKPAFILMAVILFVNITGSCIDWAQHLLTKQELATQMTNLFKKTFPDAENVVNAPLQMQRKLADLQHASGDAGSNDFLPLLARISNEADALPQVRRMDYQEGVLSIEMQVADELAAQSIAHKLTTADYIAVAENIKPSEQGVSFKLNYTVRSQ